jgi:hypothetical protein
MQVQVQSFSLNPCFPRPPAVASMLLSHVSAAAARLREPLASRFCSEDFGCIWRVFFDAELCYTIAASIPGGQSEEWNMVAESQHATRESHPCGSPPTHPCVTRSSGGFKDTSAEITGVATPTTALVTATKAHNGTQNQNLITQMAHRLYQPRHQGPYPTVHHNESLQQLELFLPKQVCCKQATPHAMPSTPHHAVCKLHIDIGTMDAVMWVGQSSARGTLPDCNQQGPSLGVLVTPPSLLFCNILGETQATRGSKPLNMQIPRCCGLVLHV